MKNLVKIMTAAALVASSGVPVAAPADAHTTSTATASYHGRTHYAHKYCRHSPATTGKVAGGVAGAVVGSKVLGGGLLGAAAGAVGGVVAGGAIDRSMTAHQRCYYPLTPRRAVVPAYAQHDRMTRPRERFYALAAVVARSDLALAFALADAAFGWTFAGRSDVRPAANRSHLPKPPPPPPMLPPPPRRSAINNLRLRRSPKSSAVRRVRSRRTRRRRSRRSSRVKPTAAPSGGGSGAGPAIGAGAGGGTGGNGYGADEAAAPTSSRSPARSRRAIIRATCANAGIGGRRRPVLHRSSRTAWSAAAPSPDRAACPSSMR